MKRPVIITPQVPPRPLRAPCCAILEELADEMFHAWEMVQYREAIRIWEL